MPFALIGSDPLALEVLAALETASDVDLEHVWFSSSASQAPVTSSAKRHERWESLLVESSLEGVFVVGQSTEIVAAAQHLAAAGLPLLVVMNITDDPAPLYDLTAIWQEGRTPVIPIFFTGLRRATLAAWQTFHASNLGDLLRIEVERQLPVGGNHGVPATASLVSTTETEQALLADLDLLRIVGAPFSQVTTIQSGRQPDGCAVATVTLGGDDLPDTTWTCRRATDEGHWTLRLIGTQGEVTLQANPGRSTPTELELTRQKAGEQLETIDAPTLSDPVAELRDAIEQAREFAPDTEREGSWLTAIRLGELIAATRRSLTRQRTITLHFDEVSERGQFKTQMTAIGCGVLLWTMFAVIGLLFVGTVLDPRDREQKLSTSMGFVLDDADFEPQSTELSSLGIAHLSGIASQWSQTPAALILVRDEATDEELLTARRASVIEALEEVGARDVPERTIVRPLVGTWYERALTIAWTLAFLPLGLFLILQMLILAARPPSN